MDRVGSCATALLDALGKKSFFSLAGPLSKTSHRLKSGHNLYRLHHTLVFMTQYMAVHHECSVEVLIAHAEFLWRALSNDQRIFPDDLPLPIWPKPDELERVDVNVERMERRKGIYIR